MFLKGRFVRSVGVFLIALVTLVSGCSNDSTTLEQRLTYNLMAEPETLDPAKAVGSPEITLINAAFEGLVHFDAEQKITPGMAESWEIKQKGKMYIFTLREGLKWSNGDPLTAKDFEYSWKRLLNPVTGAEYAYHLYCLENGEAFNQGKITDESLVGVKALDSKRLQVTLERPLSHFLSLTALHSLMPVNQRIVESDPNWFAKADTYISNGPFKMINWKNGQEISLVRNDNYWDKEQVKLEKLNFTLVDSADTELNMFESGQIDLGLNPPDQEIPRLVEEGLAGIAPELVTYYFALNLEKPPFDNLKFRQALSYAIDRQAIVSAILGSGQLAATGFVPEGMPGGSGVKDFREENLNYLTYDVAKAKALLKESGVNEGQEFPEITLIYNNEESHKRIAEAVQEMWKNNLGINIKIKSLEWKSYLDTLQNGDFQMLRVAWGADYLDPLCFLEAFTSYSGNNNTGWSSAEYDELINKAQMTEDVTERLSLLRKAEQNLLHEMPIIPVYFYTKPYMVKPNVKGLVIPPFGPDVEFRWSYIEN